MQELLPILFGALLAITNGLQPRPGTRLLRLVAVIAAGAAASLLNQEQHAWPMALVVDTALVAAGAAAATVAWRYVRRRAAGSAGRITTPVSS